MFLKVMPILCLLYTYIQGQVYYPIFFGPPTHKSEEVYRLYLMPLIQLVFIGI